MGIGTKVSVGSGRVSNCEGLRFGGFDLTPAAQGSPLKVTVSMWDGTSNEQSFELSVGETMEFSEQTWRLDEIDDQGSRWRAALTRVA